METDRKIIIASIAVVVIFLAGVVAIAPNFSNQNQTAYTIPLKNQNFGYFEMAVPEGSNFAVKNDKIGIGEGMVYWQNKANFSNETDGIIVSIKYTDRLIGQNMKLISENNTEKIYLSENSIPDYYKVVKTINGTDIIVSGHNLDLIKKMINTTKIKDTSKLVLKNLTNNAPAQNKTSVETTVENTTPAENNATIEKTVENSAPVENTEKNKTPVEKAVEQIKTENQAQAENTTTIQPKEPIMIGGGSFTTGSADADKTYARIYLGVDHAGETVGIKIFYSRDGVSLNQGNYVEATIKSDGYVNIASADAYLKYPDFAYVEVYDASGNLISTQGITLSPTSGTQYF